MPDIWGLAIIAAKLALYLGVLTSAGTVFLALFIQIAQFRRLAVGFAVLGLIATVARFLLEGAALTGDARGMTDPEMLGLLWSTAAGTAFACRLVGLTLLVAGCMFGRFGVWLSAIGGGIALWSFASVGHVAAKDMFWPSAVLLIHLIVAAMWIGVLTPLKRLADVSTAQAAADLGHRFGRIGVVLVPMLALAGAVMGYQLLGSFSALVSSGYGQALIVKIVVVAMLLGLAALNKLRFVPRLMNGDARAARQLSQAISGEWIAVIVILLTTAVLTSGLTLPS